MAGVPAVVSPQYVSHEHVKLSVAKHLIDFNHGNFVITDSNGATLLKLDHKKVFLRDLTVLHDNGDCPVVSIHKKAISLHDTYQVYRGESHEELFTVKDKHMRDGHEETYEVHIEGQPEPSYEVKGDFVRRNYEIIYDGSQIVAEVAKKHFSITSMLTGKNKYGVTINPGVDQAFIATLVVIMEAIHNEGKEKNGKGDSSDSDS